MLRLKYLKQIKMYRSQGRTIIFLDETYIHAGHTTTKCWTDNSLKGLFSDIGKGKRLIIVHAGGDMGFIPNSLLIFKSGSTSGDYHADMNGENFEKWLKEKLIPNLPPNSVIVTDNASYHNVQVDRAPTSASRKSDMIEWLISKNIAFDPNSYRVELYDIIKNNKKEHVKYKFDTLVKEHGHVLLRLPPYHPDLNPIEKIWSSVKRHVAKYNTSFKLDAVKMLAEVEFENEEKYSALWKTMCEHVVHNEDNYLANERWMEVKVPELIINVGDNSTTDSSDFEFDLDDL